MKNIHVIPTSVPLDNRTIDQLSADRGASFWTRS